MSQGLLVTSWSDVWDFGSSLFNLEDTGSAGAEKIDGDIAQLGERLPCKQEVAGSIPTISTNGIQPVLNGPVAQLARAYD